MWSRHWNCPGDQRRDSGIWELQRPTWSGDPKWTVHNGLLQWPMHPGLYLWHAIGEFMTIIITCVMVFLMGRCDEGDIYLLPCTVVNCGHALLSQLFRPKLIALWLRWPVTPLPSSTTESTIQRADHSLVEYDNLEQKGRSHASICSSRCSLTARMRGFLPAVPHGTDDREAW